MFSTLKRLNTMVEILSRYEELLSFGKSKKLMVPEAIEERV